MCSVGTFVEFWVITVYFVKIEKLIIKNKWITELHIFESSVIYLVSLQKLILSKIITLIESGKWQNFYNNL